MQFFPIKTITREKKNGEKYKKKKKMIKISIRFFWWLLQKIMKIKEKYFFKIFFVLKALKNRKTTLVYLFKVSYNTFPFLMRQTRNHFTPVNFFCAVVYAAFFFAGVVWSFCSQWHKSNRKNIMKIRHGNIKVKIREWKNALVQKMKNICNIYRSC